MAHFSPSRVREQQARVVQTEVSSIPLANFCIVLQSCSGLSAMQAAFPSVIILRFAVFELYLF